MSPLAQLLCLCFSVAGAPQPQTARSAGDIWFTHESLGHGKHLLRLSSDGFLLDFDRWRKNRMLAFATDFAGRTCPGRFVFIDGDRSTSYAGNVVFQCVK
jgi:hypothetical protein